MTDIIKPKARRSNTNAPTAAALEDGEFAINVPSKTIYYRDGASVVPVANYTEDNDSASWGNIDGELADQADLVGALGDKVSVGDSYQDAFSQPFTLANNGFNVDNLTDVDKVVAVTSSNGGLPNVFPGVQMYAVETRLLTESALSKSIYQIALNMSPSGDGYGAVFVRTGTHSSMSGATWNEWKQLGGSDDSSGGTVTSITAGNGMNFSTITESGAVTLGTPGTITRSTTNRVSSTSHTHALSANLKAWDAVVPAGFVATSGAQYGISGEKEWTTVQRNRVGSVGTQSVLQGYGWNNGVDRWRLVMENDGTLSFWSYNDVGGSATRMLSMASVNNAGYDSLTYKNNEIYHEGNLNLNDFVQTSGDQTNLSGDKYWTGTHRFNEIRPLGDSADKFIQFDGSSDSSSWLRFRKGGSGPNNNAGVVYSAHATSHWFTYNDGNGIQFSYSTENSESPNSQNATNVLTLDTAGLEVKCNSANPGMRVIRTNNNANALYSAETNSGTIYFGQGIGGSFAVGDTINLHTAGNIWLRVNSSGAFINGNEVYHTGNLTPSDYALAARSITAGNGLSGGGNFTANRTVSLGTPGTLSGTTTNSVTTSSHTHALSANLSAWDGVHPNNYWNKNEALGFLGNPVDFNAITQPLAWGLSGTTGANRPEGYSAAVTLFDSGTYAIQLGATYSGSNNYYIRAKHDVGSGYKDWATLWHSLNFNPGDYVATSGDQTGLTGNKTWTGLHTFTGTSVSWGTNPTGGVRVNMGTSTAATWIIHGWSGSTRRFGIQVIDNGDSFRIYLGTSFTTYSSNGSWSASDFAISSDSRLKADVTDLMYRGRLRPVSYTLKSTGEYKIGFIADEVQELYPELVTSDDDGYLSLSYNSTVAVVALQANRLEDEVVSLRGQVEELSNENRELKARLERIEAMLLGK